MTSLAGKRNRRSGFTLLEIVMVLAVIAMVVGIAVAIFVTSDEDGGLKGPPEELAGMVKKASRGAVVLGRTVVIAFDKKGFGVIGEGGSSSSLPDGMKVKYQRFNEGRRWTDAEGLNWPFFATGLCDPLRFRFESPQQIVELEFHPLTGSITSQNILSR
ncbi:MAG: prepilin-type N-terminal cleavage/methylation domain-containing protein [Verrucomicrobiaceae bacterium]|nr:prepilin-type N-terminal cleavage/methylation domain-containing protein [Verrucomicrobiaceae bacterium]